MKLDKLLKKLWKFALDNYFISIFFACIAFVVLVSAYKLFFSKPTYVYVKVKVGQGLWWAATQRPNIWFVNAINKGDVETDLAGKPLAEILSVRYYPWFGSDQFDIYLTLKLKVSKNKRTEKYNFKRSAIGVAAPIDLEFPSIQLSGTIADISESRFNDKLVDKVIVLTKKWAYPWEADAIIIGDTYFDGEEIIFEVLDKKIEFSQEAYNFSGTYYAPETERKMNITIRAKIKTRVVKNQLFFGPEQKITLGRDISISTNNFTFNGYTISKIE